MTGAHTSGWNAAPRHGPDPSIRPGERLAGGLGWVAAATLVLAAHGAAGWWLTRRAEAGLPLVVALDLAPVVTSAPDALDGIPLDPPTQAAANPAPPPAVVPPPEAAERFEAVASPSIPPVPLAQAQPDAPPLIEPPPEPPPAKAEARLPEAETAEAAAPPPDMPRPPPRPAPPPPAASAPRSATAPKLAAPEARQAAAPPAARQPASPRAEADWTRQVNRRVAAHMLRWRNRLRDSVTITVSIGIDGAGRVTGVSIGGSTGNAGTDASIQAHAARLSGLPAPPDGQSRTLRVPITLQGRG